ncbi:MAG TPA: patatin-like phospholipase family protein [Polyangiales bacterium]|nr:patatin-like phospholipase family protein [Polyangiales bacterium]
MACTRARIVTSLLAGLMLACAHVPQRFPLPEGDVESAEVLGIAHARLWGDEPPPWEHDWLAKNKTEMKERYPGVYGRRHAYLAISGGGEDGAFAAGLLLGWTEAGDRPEFTTVTGISAGALIAPFAFLGPEYDDVLRKVSVDVTEKDLFKKRGKIRALRTDALATTEPLQALIAKYVDDDTMQKIAAEHRKGRELNIGTTNLDSMRPVVWRIGVIANSGHPDALKLIRQILLASAAVPGGFPPVLIEIQAGDKKYDELHVDGGATSQVFLYPVGVDYDEVLDKLAVPERPEVYIIRNSRLDPTYEAVKNRLLPILGRSIESIVRTQGIGDLYRIYLQTCRDGLDFNLAYIPSDFTAESEGYVDTEYMKKLFDMAFDLAKVGYAWEKAPPKLDTESIRCN